jgi:hypothetical protein
VPIRATASSGANTSTLSANFNGTAIPAGRTLWFNSIVKLTGVPSAGATVSLRSSTIQFAASGQNYTLAVPNATITYSQSATSASTSFDAVTNTWQTIVPLSYTGNVFLSGLAYPVAADLPGGVGPVTWAGTFTSATAGLSAQWKWAAAVYTQFATDPKAIGAKPIDGGALNPYPNSDHAGTPENYKPYVTGGAMGGGGSNWTGGYSGTATVPVAVVAPGYVFAFTSNRDSTSSIYMMNTNGTGLARITSGIQSAQADWPSNGSTIAFVGGPCCQRQIYVVNTDGSNLHQLFGEGADNIAPEWSPDGTKLAYSNAGVEVVNADGSNRTVLQYTGTLDTYPSWSPDGSKIAFTSTRTGIGHIFVMNADGSNAQQLTGEPASQDQHPSWSPDGSKIVFERCVGGSVAGNAPWLCSTQWDLFVMNADGSNPQNLTNTPNSNETGAKYTPDGKMIGFTTDRDGNAEVYLMNADGTNPMNVTNAPASSDGEPDFKP